MKNILFLATESFGGFGGIAQYNRDFLTALSRSDRVENVWVLQRLTRNSSFVLPDKIDLCEKHSIGKIGFFVNAIRLAFKKREVDEIICGHINYLPIAFLIALLKGKKVTLLIYGIDAWEKPSGALWGIAKYAISRVISISDATKRKFIAWSKFSNERVEILPNAVHMEQYSLSKNREELKKKYKLESRRVLLTLGRMSASERYKGFDEVLDIVKTLSTKISNIIYVIAGDGDDRQRLQKRVSDESLSEFVLFTGLVTDEQRLELFQLADLYVMPSYGEGFGFVLLEALACGTPAIGSLLDGTREALRDGLLGDLVDPKNSSQLLDVVVKNLNKPHSIPEGLGYYSFPNFCKRTEDLILG
ncbi:MAG: glycosyltransferase family 4 protein [Gammaproteobacteria bacterium]|nr:glycosyltransferase family 4 protein [Gammaproteobacteria bacterium]